MSTLRTIGKWVAVIAILLLIAFSLPSCAASRAAGEVKEEEVKVPRSKDATTQSVTPERQMSIGVSMFIMFSLIMYFIQMP